MLGSQPLFYREVHPMSPEAIYKLVMNMLDASVVTLEVFFLTLIFALPLGLLVSAGRM